MILDQRPAWHTFAACNGDHRWLDDPGQGVSLEPLRRVCRACPVAGECLVEALGMPQVLRHEGVLRCGVYGRQAWRVVEALVAELQPVTPADWSAFAAWLVDGDLAEVEVAARPERVAVVKPRHNARPVVVVKRRRGSGPELVVGAFPSLRHYDVKPAERTMTRAELLAARATA